MLRVERAWLIVLRHYKGLSGDSITKKRSLVAGSTKGRYGGVTERPNVPVLKTGDGVTHPRVQISPPPPFFNRL